MNYIIENKYQIGNLKPYIYLFPKDTTKIKYVSDNGKYYVEDIVSDNVVKINGNKTTFTEEQIVNGMFSYKSSVVLMINEMADDTFISSLERMKYEKYFIVIEDKMGNKFIQSPEFTSEMSWKIYFNNSVTDSNYVELRLDANTNIPSILVVPVITNPIEYNGDDCNYHIGINDNFMICEKAYCYAVYDNNNILNNIYTTGSKTFNKIVPNKKSFAYTHAYTNNTYKDEITFTIPLSDYKSNFHNKLEEFNNNRYVIKFNTLDNKTIVCGLEFGLFPKYTISTSEEDSNLNVITITFTHISQTGIVYSPIEIPISQDTSTYFVPAKNIIDPLTNEELFTEFCITDNKSIITLLQLSTSTGELIDAFYCLNGYETYYANINLIGTYTKEENLGVELINNSFECAKSDVCQWLRRLPLIMNFYGLRHTETVEIKSTCDWQVSKKPGWLSITPFNGKANELVKVSLQAIKRPLDFTFRDVVEFKSGVNTMQTTVILSSKKSWITKTNYNITAKAQPVAIRHTIGRGDAIAFSNLSEGIVNITANSEYIVANVSDNESLQNIRNITFTATDKNTGDEVQISIIQDKLYQLWIRQFNEFICIDNNSYVKEYEYIGYYPDEINIPTGETRSGDLIKENDSQCYKTIERWDVGENYICNNGNKYQNLIKYISYNSGETWEYTGENKIGELLEVNSADCSDEYIWMPTTETVCLGGNKYLILKKFHILPTGEKVDTGETKLGELLETQSLDCLKESNYIKLKYSFGQFSYYPEDMFLIKSRKPFFINWGDGTPVDYYEASTSGVQTKHKIIEDSLGSGNIGTLVIGGDIDEIVILSPNNCIGFNYLDFDLTNATKLYRFTSNSVINHFSNYDLSKNENLVYFQCNHNQSYNGIEVFNAPKSIRQIYLGNNIGEPSYITYDQMQLLIDNLPSVNCGVIDLCYNGSSDICALDSSYALSQGWYVNLGCCPSEGNKAYLLGDHFVTECDTVNHIKWRKYIVLESIYQNGEWQLPESTSSWVKNDIIEFDSEDCGYIPSVTYKWELSNTYTCTDDVSYFNEQKYESRDGGKSWFAVIPNEYRISTVIKKTDDPLCGYNKPLARLERWVISDNEYICDTAPSEGGEWE